MKETLTTAKYRPFSRELLLYFKYFILYYCIACNPNKIRLTKTRIRSRIKKKETETRHNISIIHFIECDLMGTFSDVFFGTDIIHFIIGNVVATG